MKGTDILITGGYGTVGRRVAADLAPFYSGRVVVAGRSAEKAAQLAAELGHGVRGRRVDVGDLGSVEAALDSVCLVMSCIGQPEPHLLRAAIARGLAYTDIAPHLMTRRPTEAMRAEAVQTGARIVLGTGLAPGISSLLARLGEEYEEEHLPGAINIPLKELDRETIARLDRDASVIVYCHEY